MPLAPQPMKPGMGLKSPIGGPSGPGSSPMVSPGTGAGMQARALQDLDKMVPNLMQIGASFPRGTKEFTVVADIISKINGLMKKKPEETAPKQPLPVPPTPPGAGLGGMGGGPPGGAAPPMGGPPMGAPGGIAPEM